MIKSYLQIKTILLSVAVFIAASIIYLYIPYKTGGLKSYPQPARTYEEAVQRMDSFRRQEAQTMNPLCHSILLTHGKKTKRAIVFFHGYTNCPEQFRILGNQLYDSGYNVLVLPMKHHGLADRLNHDHALITAEYLASFADESIDIARGLGDHLTIAGLSLGGILTAWAAQNRNDIDLALVISPSVGFKTVPSIFTRPVASLFRIMSGSFIWWNDKKQGDDGPQYAYPQFSTKALGESLRLAFALQQKAGEEKPLAEKIVVITNAADKAINNEAVYDLIKDWKKNRADVCSFEFEDSLHLCHDLIDPNQSDQRIDIVYPRLMDIILSKE